MASSPSTTEAKGDVACFEDMTLLWSKKRRIESGKVYQQHMNMTAVFHGPLVMFRLLCMAANGIACGAPEQMMLHGLNATPVCHL